MHIPVLLHEAIEGLDIHPGETFVDATLGNGGHSEEVAKTFGDTVAMIGIDLDPDALFRSKTRLAPLNPNIRYAEGSFRNIDDILKKFGVSKADKILFDLGWSSEQFAASGRGFSFQIDEPLLMTFGKVSSSDSSANITAWQIVNEWDEENIATILSGYGEERFAKPIARAIVRARKLRSIDTTAELVEIILSSTPKFYHHRKIHPATKTFQALRITTNDEIGALKDGLEKGFDLLKNGGRMAVISFHSIEDRIVKRYFKSLTEKGQAVAITKKPTTAKEEEIVSNPRSRSAKLRIIEKNQPNDKSNHTRNTI